MKKQKTKDLLKILEVLLDQKKLEQKLKNVKTIEQDINRISQEVLETQKLVKSLVDHLETNKKTIDSIKKGLQHIQKTFKNQTKGDLDEWSVDIEALHIWAVLREIYSAFQIKVTALSVRTKAIAKVCLILDFLQKLVKKVDNISKNLSTLDHEENITVAHITKLKQLEEKLKSLLQQAKELGADPYLMTFLEKASSVEGASGQDLDKNILQLLEKNRLKNLITIKLTERN